MLVWVGDGVVCGCGVVLDGVPVAGNCCEDGVVVWGWFLGTTGIFPKFLGHEGKYFKHLFYQGFPFTSHSSSLHLFTRSSAKYFPHLTVVKYLSSERWCFRLGISPLGDMVSLVKSMI